MPDWLEDAVRSDVQLTFAMLALRMALALILGGVVAGIYTLTRRPGASDSSNLIPTLVLLTVLIAMVTMVIGGSVARAFSLVGALAIVRFRTVVEDTRDTAFVIFAVAVGMAIGTGGEASFKIPLVGIPFAALAAFLFRPRALTSQSSTPDHVVTIRIGMGRAPEAALQAVFDKHLERARLTATTTARQGAALDLTYSVRMRAPENAIPLVTELNGIEGVQSVELRQA